MALRLIKIIKPTVHILTWCILFAFSFVIAEGLNEKKQPGFHPCLACLLIESGYYLLFELFFSY